MQNTTLQTTLAAAPAVTLLNRHIRNWKLVPSDFAFAYEECKRCFYLKNVEGFQRPRPPMPKIFGVIDLQMKKCFSSKRTEEIAPGLPPGVIEYGEKWVQSEPILLPQRTSTCFIRGKFDTVVKFDDGSYGVVDFKTSHRKDDHIPLYARQLHAYAHALENAAPGKLSVRPIRKLGLLVFEPMHFSDADVSALSLYGSLEWIEIPRNDDGFMAFLSDLVALLESPEPPPGSAACHWCQYRDTSRRIGL